MSYGSRLPVQRCSIYVYEIAFGYQPPKPKGINAGARGTYQQDGLVHMAQGRHDGIIRVQ
jgi:hypothetical protein